MLPTMRKQIILPAIVAVFFIICMLASYHRSQNCLKCEPITEDHLFQSTCPAKTQRDHVFFLKIHKCGSSTVQNILMRRGYSRELNFVLAEKSHYLGHPTHFHKGLVDQRFFTSTEHFDILTHHSRFNPQGVDEIMPPDTKKFAILREPTALFESLYNYYRLSRAGYQKSLKDLLMYDTETLKRMARNSPRWANIIGFNQMAFDAGMESSDFDDAAKVDELIAMMDEQFDLVMISEYMEASMVLMADIMCWPLEEVTFLKLNARPSNSTFRTKLSNEEKVKLRAANSADYKIYEHFKKKFQQRVSDFGRGRAAQRVGLLKSLNEKLTKQCIKRVIPPAHTKSNDYPVFTYEINEGAPDICQLVAMEELKFTALLKEKQLERFGIYKDFEDLIGV